MAARSPSRAGGGPSQRQLRVGELVRHALSEILQRGDIPDPVLETHPVTVPEVRMSPDLKHATAYVMPLGGSDQEAVVQALIRHRAYLRGLLAKKVEVKYMPDLRFELDPSFEEAQHIDDLLRSPKVARDLDQDGD
ncbi:30S ribosome-binding factor RbfA [Lutibaculum baratangense]|uniref:Ribosome-binding factor A n=1 Tax=Lutibaculum baratangense AMV1 TaxID=631454 RepID=V4R1L3_9HYPH|nr:30S ribosome-binding factor RbfA [Lutibaculum baratangense]ESR25867.1 Ribosome-binding factor A [Lutibaculum baratangense AMV1]